MPHCDSNENNIYLVLFNISLAFITPDDLGPLLSDDFESLLRNNKFQIIHTFGDFNLNPFDEKTSDRLILIATKN